MNSTERLPVMQWANIHRTERFISFEPLSGYRRALRENEGYVIYLPPITTDEALGRALLEVLDKSRFIWPPDEPEFFEWQRYVRCIRNWEKDFVRRYGYKSKREAYKNMDWCVVRRSEGKISITPHKRDKPEYFINLPPLVIQATTDAAVIGGALRQALDRCE